MTYNLKPSKVRTQNVLIMLVELERLLSTSPNQALTYEAGQLLRDCRLQGEVTPLELNHMGQIVNEATGATRALLGEKRFSAS